MTGPSSTDPTGPADPAELLSAHLDDELSADEQADVERLLAQDPAARAERDELARVRAALRGLPAVEPPAGFLDGLLAGGVEADPAAPVSLDERRARRRSPVARVVAVALAAAAVVLVMALVGVVGSGDDGMVPPVAEFAARHEAVAMHEGPVTDGFEPMSDAELDAMDGPLAAPAELAGAYRRQAGFHDESGTLHLVYGDDDRTVSVYAQPGQVDFAGLPAAGDRMEMDGAEAWMAPAVPLDGGTVEVVVLQRGDTAYTFVADAPHDEVMAVVDDLARATGA